MITIADFMEVDLPAMLTGLLAALACALTGNFLVLRRQSLLGDAIGHGVLPGIVIAFLLTGSTGSLPMFLGALAAALLAAWLSDLVRRKARLEAGAAMAVVFTTMFSIGVLLLEQSAASNVHLDVQHSLMGNLEGIVWLGAKDPSAFLDPERLAALPVPLLRLAVLTGLLLLLVCLFLKELRVTTFDPVFADVTGTSSALVSSALMIATAMAAVAAFDAVGSILVIAMFVCPPATARLLTDRLSTQVLCSALFAAIAAIAGYVLAAWVPLWLGAGTTLSAAGMMAVVAGVMQMGVLAYVNVAEGRHAGRVEVV